MTKIKKYKLLYISYINNDNITNSVQMFSFGIINEFKKLDVELLTLNLSDYNIHSESNIEDMKECIEYINTIKDIDFVLCHIYSGSAASILYDVLKKITKYEVASFIETPICGWKFDKYFLYFDTDSWQEKKEKYVVYNAPILKSFYTKIKKEEKSILLDHRWEGYLGTNKEKSDDIIEWLKELSNEYKIYKLIRYSEKQLIPDYITPIPHCNFQDYLKLIANKEIFISTHFGSYNSTVIDMLGFGAKCIIPKIDGQTFIPQYNIDLFNLSTFSNKEELIEEIKKPLDNNLLNQIDNCTDISYIINDIHNKFMDIKNKN